VVQAFVRPQEVYSKQYDANALEARLNKVATGQKLEASADGTAELLNSEEIVRPPTLKKMVEETTERDKTAQNRNIQSLEHRLRNAEVKAAQYKKQAQKQKQDRDSTSGKDKGAPGRGANAKKSQPAPSGKQRGKPNSNAPGAAAAANASTQNSPRRGVLKQIISAELQQIQSQEKQVQTSLEKEVNLKYGFLPNPSFTPFHNAVIIRGHTLAHHYFSQPSNLAFHDLTPGKIISPLASSVLGLNMKYIPTPKFTTYDLTATMDRLEWDII
jgi:hypothetical protein